VTAAAFELSGDGCCREVEQPTIVASTTT